jgi:hypothetical protein
MQHQRQGAAAVGCALVAGKEQLKREIRGVEGNSFNWGCITNILEV